MVFKNSYCFLIGILRILVRSNATSKCIIRFLIPLKGDDGLTILDGFWFRIFTRNDIRGGIPLNNDDRFKKGFQTIQKFILVRIISQKPSRLVNPSPLFEDVNNLVDHFGVELLQTRILQI